MSNFISPRRSRKSSSEHLESTLTSHGEYTCLQVAKHHLGSVHLFFIKIVFFIICNCLQICLQPAMLFMKNTTKITLFFSKLVVSVNSPTFRWLVEVCEICRHGF